ncbi:MAG: CvpA family protein [Gemmatales bacterium]|nr:CvpA family protein [Gemmatales bacterium]MDW8385770.1 CvpA family protein [Gemmatales bacterium]
MGYPPVLEILTLALMLALGVLQQEEGAFRAWLLFVHVLFAGFLTFDLFEPMARALGQLGPTWDLYADAVAITVLFCVIVLALRWITGRLMVAEPALPWLVRRFGGFVLGAATGYVVAGMLLCMVQTLPLPQRFLWYDPDNGIGLGSPDRVWLAMMHRASGVVFDRPRGQTRWFDADGSFILRYARYRRLSADGTRMQNRGEFPSILEVKPTFGGCDRTDLPEKLNP